MAPTKKSKTSVKKPAVKSPNLISKTTRRRAPKAKEADIDEYDGSKSCESPKDRQKKIARHDKSSNKNQTTQSDPTANSNEGSNSKDPDASTSECSFVFSLTKPPTSKKSKRQETRVSLKTASNEANSSTFEVTSEEPGTADSSTIQIDCDDCFNGSDLDELDKQKKSAPSKKRPRKPRTRNAEEEETMAKLVKKFCREPVTKKGQCLVDDCRSKPITWRPYNLKRHLKQMHSKDYKRLFAEEIDIDKATQIELFNVVQDAVALVTVDGLPLTVFHASGMRGFISPRLKFLQSNGYKISINRWNVLQEVEKVSNYIEGQIKKEMAGKMISVMYDVATKGTLSVLGVNATYIVDGNIVCRSLGIKQINVRHTAVNLADMLYDILAKYEVPLDNVFAAITDNARNVVNSAAVLDRVANSNVNPNEEGVDSTENEFDCVQEFDDDTIDEENESELRNIMENAHNSCRLVDDMCDHIITANDQIVLINHLNCGTHTVQLGVNDAFNDSNAQPTFNEAKEICIALRNQVVMIEFRKIVGKKILPPLDNATRWNSKYVMV